MGRQDFHNALKEKICKEEKEAIHDALKTEKSHTKSHRIGVFKS